jgi:tetratricopeptide (TPR) repeat protein
MTRTSIRAKTRDARLRPHPTALRLGVLLLWASCWVMINTDGIAAQARGYMIWGDVNIHLSNDDDPGPTRLTLFLYNRVGRLVARQTVTPHGRYRFSNLNAGEYELAVEVENAEVTRIRFELAGSPDSDYRQDLQLEWKSKASHKTTVGVVSAADVYSRSPANQELFQKAQQASDKKKYDQAESHLREIVDNDKLDFQAWTLLGTIYVLQKKLDDADRAYGSALAANPTFFLALIDLGKLRSSQNKFEEAIDPLTQAVAVQAQSGEANLLLGEAYLQTKKGSKAVPYLNEAAKLDRPEAHLRLAWLYNAVGSKDKAALEYVEFLKKKPDYAERRKLQEYIEANKKD